MGIGDAGFAMRSGDLDRDPYHQSRTQIQIPIRAHTSNQFQAERTGLTRTSPTAAKHALAAPTRKANPLPFQSHISPNAIDAGSTAAPMTPLYQPNAMPRRVAGTRSATSARSTPSVSPKNNPE